jgi:hypothetical protein
MWKGKGRKMVRGGGENEIRGKGEYNPGGGVTRQEDSEGGNG